jgi:hypothetical protein
MISLLDDIFLDGRITSSYRDRTVVLFAPGSVKELGIPVILTTLPCNKFAFKPKNKKNNFCIN